MDRIYEGKALNGTVGLYFDKGDGNYYITHNSDCYLKTVLGQTTVWRLAYCFYNDAFRLVAEGKV